uniref:Uncharacterized protein n=1 Tax=Meloidogyne incognita TaxID=6306 RepID=A0A914M7N8_MELIC
MPTFSMHYIIVLLQHNFTTKNYQNLRELLKLKKIRIFNVVFVLIILKKVNLHNQLLVHQSNIFFTLIVFTLDHRNCPFCRNKFDIKFIGFLEPPTKTNEESSNKNWGQP